MRKLSRDDMLSKVKSRPWRRPWACLVFLFSSFLIFSSCATITPFGSEGVDGTMTLTKQEEVLWDDSRREQRQIAYSKMLYRDEALDTYLNRVARTVLPLEASGELLEVSVNVILSPYLNAFAYPNGAVYIHSGMLARIENEAQLAALIGHELTHATHRHLLRSTRT
ncbi:MAG: M48 family metalloprotease, partial [Deltaproteobacteria bacterium]|nr:M48 family metalloprotease [Deltaproteobacteria bacterium]